MKLVLTIVITVTVLTLHAIALEEKGEAAKYRERMDQVQALQYELSDAITQKSSEKP